MDMLFLTEVSLAGLASGGLYAVGGISFVLIYKATKVVNMAVGELLMLGAYLFFGFAAGLALPIWVAILATLVAAGAMGWLVERVMIRPMLGENPISVFMLTIGLGSMVIGIVELVWGADPLRLPEFMPSAPLFIGDAYVSAKVATSFAVALIVMTSFLVMFRFWRGGVALRATAGDQAAAYSVGINVPKVFSLAWVIGCAIAAGAGILVGAVGGISPNMGAFGLAVIVVVIVGGLDSIAGAVVAGIFVGLIEALAGAYLGGEYKPLTTFSLLAIVLMVRPYGLFGTHEIERL